MALVQMPPQGLIAPPPPKRSRNAPGIFSLSTHVEIPRTSSLKAPIMLLTGHESAVYTMKFDPTGRNIASGSHDKNIFLWNVTGDCDNYNVLSGHKNVVLDLEWNASGSKIVSASADKMVGLWDANRGTRQKKYSGHQGVVNSVNIARGGDPLIVSGSDDCCAMVWDMRQRQHVQVFESPFQVTAACFSADRDMVFTAGIDNKVRAWDRKSESVTFVLDQHTDTITGMSLSPDGTTLLTNAMDKSLILWDVRPYTTANPNRIVRPIIGAQHSLEKNLLKCSWSPDGQMISAGSSDRVVHIWDVPTGEELYHLPGHQGSVNEVAFHPTEPIIGSCGSDKQIYLGEIQGSFA